VSAPEAGGKQQQNDRLSRELRAAQVPEQFRTGVAGLLLRLPPEFWEWADAEHPENDEC